MLPTEFPQCNAFFTSPEGMDESQVKTIPAYLGKIEGGNLDGSKVVVTAWQPTPHEIAKIAAGQPVFLTFLGGLPPHMATTSFEDATTL